MTRPASWNQRRTITLAAVALGTVLAGTAAAKPLRDGIAISATWTAGPMRLLFARDVDYRLWVLEQTGSINSWSDFGYITSFQDLQGSVIPVVVQRGPNNWETHVFYLQGSGDTMSIGYRVRTGAGPFGGWNPGADLPPLPPTVHIGSGLGASSNVYRRGDGLEPQGSYPQIAVYFISTNGGLYTATYQNNGWSTSWTSLGVPPFGYSINYRQIDVTNEFATNGAFSTSVWVMGKDGFADRTILAENRGPFDGQRTWTNHTPSNGATLQQRPAAVSWYDRTGRGPNYLRTRVMFSSGGSGDIYAFFRNPGGVEGWESLNQTTITPMMSASTYVGSCGGCMNPPQMSVVVSRDDNTGNLFYLAKDNSNTKPNFVDVWTALPPAPINNRSGFTRVDFGAGLSSVYAVNTTGRLIEYTTATNQWVSRGFPNLAYSYQSYAFDAGDSRGYTGQGDWAVNEFKGECAANQWVSGVSTGGMTGPTHSIQCTSTDPAPSFTTGQHTLNLTSDNDGFGNHGLGDWDYGFIKGECAANEIVTGLAESGVPLNHVRCSAAAGAVATNCRPLLIPTSDNRESPRNSADWATGYLKAECRNGSAVTGISRDVSTGATHGVLCCDFNVF